ncbi:MAG: hypothetical protein R3C25_12095 [Hyphomonadaceae bacterium]
MWRWLFAVAALFNFAVGGVMLAAPWRVAPHLSVTGPGGSYIVAMTGSYIAVFGLGYAIAAAAPIKNRGIIWMGAVSKLAAAALWSIQFGAQVIEFRVFVIGMIDVVFAALFGLFLRRSRHVTHMHAH